MTFYAPIFLGHKFGIPFTVLVLPCIFIFCFYSFKDFLLSPFCNSSYSASMNFFYFLFLMRSLSNFLNEKKKKNYQYSSYLLHLCFFRDLRLVNWDCVLLTAISDLEVFPLDEVASLSSLVCVLKELCFLF